MLNYVATGVSSCGLWCVSHLCHVHDVKAGNFRFGQFSIMTDISYPLGLIALLVSPETVQSAEWKAHEQWNI